MNWHVNCKNRRSKIVPGKSAVRVIPNPFMRLSAARRPGKPEAARCAKEFAAWTQRSSGIGVLSRPRRTRLRHASPVQESCKKARLLHGIWPRGMKGGSCPFQGCRSAGCPFPGETDYAKRGNRWRCTDCLRHGVRAASRSPLTVPSFARSPFTPVVANSYRCLYQAVGRICDFPSSYDERGRRHAGFKLS